MFRSFLILTSFLVAAVICSAQSCAELVPQLLVKSHVDLTLKAFNDDFVKGVESGMPEDSMSSEERARIHKAISSVFQGEKFGNAVIAKLMRNCNAQKFSAALAEMDSPIQQKFLGYDADSALPENIVKEQRYVRAMALQSPREARVKLIEMVMDSTGAREFAADSQSEISLQMMSAAFRSSPSKQQEESFRAEMRSATLKQCESSYMFIYRAATDEELKEFAESNSTPAMKSFNSAVNSAMLDVIRTDSYELGTKIRDAALQSKDH